MRRKVWFVVLPFLLFAQFAFSAENDPQVNFDQNVDASSLLREARELAARQLTPIPRVERKLLKLKKRRKTLGGPGQYQPVSPLISNSAAFSRGASLRGDPLYLALDPVTLKPLDADWANITAVRSDLLSQSSDWDGVNEHLYSDGQQLDIDLAALNQRQATLNAEIGQYNQACTTHPLPPDQYQACVNWRDGLIQRKSQLESNIAEYNGRADSWNRQSAAIFQRRGALIGLIQAWETRIQDWLASATKAIAALCRPLKTFESRPTQETVFTGGFTWEFEARVTFEIEPKDAPPCEVDLLWTLDAHPDVPNTSIGMISPRSGAKTTFKSGNFTGLGTLVLQDLKSGRGTASIVNVRNPSK